MHFPSDNFVIPVHTMLAIERNSSCKRCFLALSVLLVATFLVSGCAMQKRTTYERATVDQVRAHPAIAILPIKNNTQHFQATESASLILENRLRVEGYRPQEVSADYLQIGRDYVETPSTSLGDTGHRYALTGNINNWRAEDIHGARPQVEVELTLHNIATNKVIWSGDRRETGSVNAALTAVADKAFGNLVAQIPRDLLTEDTSVAIEQNGQASPPLAAAVESSLLNTVSSADSKLTANGFLKVGTQAMEGRSVALYYAHKPPIDELSLFDRVILEPDAVEPNELKQLVEKGSTPYAYLSIGEVGPDRAYARSVKRAWVLGENSTWNSKVFDLTKGPLQEFLLKRVATLVEAGYQGLFLDTMDSYQLYAKNPEARAAQEASLVHLLGRIKELHPSLRLIANRGFEVLDSAAPYLEAVAAESLYASWDNNKKEYVEVSASDREWLLGQLRKASDVHNLDVISIEYVPPSRRKEAVAVAKVVAAHGFIPWVSTPAFDHVGVGLLEPLPRKVMFLFDSRVDGPDWEASVHKLLAVPAEYMGLVPVYHDMGKLGLPAEHLAGEFRGVMTFTFSAYQMSGYQQWIEQQFEDGLPVVSFGHPGFRVTSELADIMGVSPVASFDSDSAKVIHRDDSIGYERDLVPRIENFSYLLKNESETNHVYLSFSDSSEQAIDAVVTGDWGGFALNPALADYDVDGVVHWIIDPFEFIESALGLEGMPMPDVTTENGKRLFLAHIDGDALPSWAEMPGRKLGAEVVYENILTRYNLPHTISIVEGEMTGFQQYADRQLKMMEVARTIFAMPNVELATHTYSHPFKWQKVAAHKGSGKYNLKLDGYQFDAEREILGSAAYIDKFLAPEGKKTRVFLWSGDALPDEKTMKAVYDSGLINMNGGNTVISSAKASLSQISPMSRMVGPYVQVYAPIMNENVFTNDWTGPFDGFRRVIETLEMTNKPRRLKPLNIYYHFYAGTKTAALRSLEDVYDYASAEDINPVYVSDYSVKVPDFRTTMIGRYLDGSWKATGLGNIRTLRVVDGETFPKLSSSRHITGAKRLHDGIYIHTDGADSIHFRMGDKKIARPHLVSANGKLEHWSRKDGAVSFRVIGHQPVVVELGGTSISSCGISGDHGVIKGSKSASGTYLYKFNKQDTGNVRINCQT